MKTISPFCKLTEDQISRLENKVLIGGKLIKPHSTNSFPVIHSARLQEVCHQINCDSQDVDHAVATAKQAQKEWARKMPRQRGTLLQTALAKVSLAKDEIVQLLTLETSKAVRTESELDFAAAIDIFGFFSGLGSEIKGQTLPFRPDVLAYTVREPLGVVGAIIPWNVPLMLMALKVGPALVAGNSVVVKTSEYAPLATLRFAEILNETLPPGILNVISGHGNPTGQELINHPSVNKITFTGSVATGKTIYRQSADRLIPVTLELGGKSPMIICGDADLDKVVQGAFQGMRFTRQGQSCSAGSRIFAHEDLIEPFLQKLGQRLENLVIGDPFDPKVEAGAVACQMQYDKIQGYLGALERGQYRQFSSKPQGAELSKGLFMVPTVVTGAKESDSIATEEVFGPVVCVFPWKKTDDVIRRANQTSYGLAATVWTQNIQTALQMTDQLEAGFVQVNQNLVVQATLSYGGYKNSGLGKEASLESMIEHFTKSKTVMMAREV